MFEKVWWLNPDHNSEGGSCRRDEEYRQAGMCAVAAEVKIDRMMVDE